MTIAKEGKNIAVIGSGSWGTALVKILSENKDNTIRWWVRKPEDVQHIINFGHNPSYLSDVQIDKDVVSPLNNVVEAIDGADIVIIVTPAAFVLASMEGVTAAMIEGKILVNAVKGMLPSNNLPVTNWLEKAFNVPAKNQAVIGGPCHAEEVALERLSYLTIAGTDNSITTIVAKALACRYVYTSTNLDLYGVEYCAIMKNIVALTCGICHGLNYGDNFQAVLVSNAMHEIKSFLNALYPTERDLTKSAYLGDLLVTAYSQFSRNRTFGNMIGRGYSVKSAQMEMNMIAEGYYAVNCVNILNQTLKVDMPITTAAYNILYLKHNPQSEIDKIKMKFS